MSLPGYLPDRGAAGQARLQWTTAQGDPPTGRHAKPYRNARQLHHRRRARVTADSTWLVQPRQSLVLSVAFRQRSWTGWTLTTLVRASP